MRDHVEGYLSELREIRDSGRAVDETSCCLLGESTLDVYLNGSVCWQNVPARVWHTNKCCRGRPLQGFHSS